ncbi:MAG: hypothetical protein G01um101413_451 [Parcubacteria group bacterium Gr01-1014_13]|nr:MAG: hypothetical protein G01um101413_451 [Parcubacteria group bacterium Gr01-1014_13]
MTKTPCELWFDLFCGDSRYTSKLFNDFLTYRSTLTRHLKRCEKCRNIFIQFNVRASIIPNSNMNDQEFSKAIREIWKFARKKK